MNVTKIILFSFINSGKFEEKEEHVPKLEQLNSLSCMTSMNLMLNKHTLLHLELLLLESFQWNLCLPTAAHFIDYYLSIAVHETDLHDGWPLFYLEKTKLYTIKYSSYFLEVSLQGIYCPCNVFLNQTLHLLLWIITQVINLGTMYDDRMLFGLRKNSNSEWYDQMK